MFKAFKNPELRQKLIFTLFILIIYRAIAHIPVPGVDLNAVRGFLDGNALFGLFDLFSGGAFQNFSIITLGLNPYINAAIIMQLFTIMVPELERLSKEEGEAGREKINMYSRMLSLPIALGQSYGMYFFLSRQGVIGELNTLQMVVLVLSLTAGTTFLMWLGELVTEYGISNGISLIIFAGIVSAIPSSFMQFASNFSSQDIPNIILFTGVALASIVGIVLVNEGTRNVPLAYGRTSNKTSKISNYLPIKINQAGVIPIIFAVSVVLVPSLLSGPLSSASNSFLRDVGVYLGNNFTPSTLGYNVIYFFLVFGFTYFYTALQFDPKKISDDVKKRGGFIPGVRPGKSTTDYLKRLTTRITLVGAVFLGFVAVLPFLIQSALNINTFAIGGAGLLIVVSVVLETKRQVDAKLVSNNYSKFLD